MAMMSVRDVALDKLQPDNNNPNTHDDRNLEAIKVSLVEHGQVEPLVVQKGTMMVIGGNGRLEMMQELGWEKAACAMIDVDDQQARRLSIALNRTSELSEWDFGVLAKHLDDLSKLQDDFDPEGLGFTGEEFMELISSIDDWGIDEMSLAEKSQSGEITPVGQAEAIPAGTQPKDMPASHVRMIQLFFNEETEPEFRLWAARLAEQHNTENLTDTVYAVFKAAATA